MQIFLSWLVVFFALLAIHANARKIKTANPRNPLRIVGMIIGGYIGCVYFLFALGYIDQAHLTPLLRWFWSVIMVYLIVEAQNG